MNQTHPEAPAKHTPTDINAAPRKGRRKLIQAGSPAPRCCSP